jgi:NADH-quinone oxidoreductase subunit L
MTGVLWILAILAVVGGALGLPEFLHMPNFLGTWLEPVFSANRLQPLEGQREMSAGLEMGLMLLSVLAAVAGWAVANSLYGAKASPRYEKAQGLDSNTLLQNKYYVDEAYDAAFVKPGRWFAGVTDAIDRYFVDGIVWMVAFFVQAFGEAFRFMQSGYIRWYAWGLLGGATVLLIKFALLK